MLLTKPQLITIAGATFCSSLVIAYAIYIFRKQRSTKKGSKKFHITERGGGECYESNIQNSKEDRKRCFMDEVHKGEQLIAVGDTKNGVQHLANAVFVCTHPDEMMKVLEQTLPGDLYEMVENAVYKNSEINEEQEDSDE